MAFSAIRHFLRQLSTVRALQLFQLFRQGAAIIIAIVFAKSRLSTAEIGVYEMLFYLSYAASFFWVSGLVQGLLTYHPLQSRSAQRLLWTQAYLVFLLISLLLAVVLWYGRAPVLMFLTGQPEIEYWAPFLLFLLLHYPASLLENYYVLRERPVAILGWGFFSWGGQVLVVLSPVLLGWGLRWSIVGLVGLAFLRHVWLLTFVFRHGRWGWDRGLASRWLTLSLPILAYALVGGFNYTFDNWLVNYFYGGDERQFAIFRYGARELPLATALAGALSSALLPKVAEDVRAALPELRRKSRNLLHWLFPISILLLLSSDWLFGRVFNPEFRASAPVFNTFLLIILSRLVFSRTVLVGLQQNRSVLYISLIELAANVLLSALFIPWLGLVGVALGTVLAHLLEKIIQAAYLYRKYGIGPGAYTDLKWLGGYSALLVGGYGLSWIAG